MTKFMAIAWFGLLIACGSSKPNTTGPGSGSGSAAAAECAPTDCGAEPPISPSACPTGEAVSTVCRRESAGTCERHIQCNGKDAAAPTATAPAQ